MALEDEDFSGYLLINHDRLNLTSSCVKQPATLEAGSYKLAGDNQGNCDTTLDGTDLLLSGAISVLKYTSRGWTKFTNDLWKAVNNQKGQNADPSEPDEPEDWNTTSLFLLLGLSLVLLLLAAAVVTVSVVLWKHYQQ